MDRTTLTEQLVVAVRDNHTDEALSLIAQGADSTYKDSWFLRLAATNGNAELVRELLKTCDPLLQDSAALRLAAEAGNKECVDLLIPVSNVLARDGLALTYAAGNGFVDVVHSLAQHMDVCINSGDAFSAALINNHSRVLECLYNNLHNTSEFCYDFWLKQAAMHREMGFFHLMNPTQNLSQEGANAILGNYLGGLDSEGAQIVLQKAQHADGTLPFMQKMATKRTTSHPYRFLETCVALGNSGAAGAFFDHQKANIQVSCVMDLLHAVFEHWEYYKNLPDDKVVEGLRSLLPIIQDTLASERGDAVLRRASKLGREAVFVGLLPYCNLDRAYQQATGSAKDVWLMEKYKALRTKELLEQEIGASVAATAKRRM